MALLERKDELDRLTAAFAAARTGTGNLALVSGEAGIGKTTLVRHFTQSLDSTSARVLIGFCDPLFTPSPFAPLYDIVRQIGGDLAAALDRAPSRTLMFNTVHAALAALKRPAVLVFEDIHWADEATLDLLKFLARRLDGMPLLLIATYRDDALGRHAPLQSLLGALTGSVKAERLALARLSVAAVRRLTEGQGLDAEALHRQTSGNPFFLAEAIASRKPGIPATVRDAVMARVAQLTPKALRLIEIGSIIGSRIDPDLLERVAGAAAESLA